jgi:ribosomal protein S27AE
MAIVWPCSMTAHDYAAAGRNVKVPRPDCPACGAAMIFFGSYTRPLRIGAELRVVIRRARCSPCAATHALINVRARMGSSKLLRSWRDRASPGEPHLG